MRVPIMFLVGVGLACTSSSGEGEGEPNEDEGEGESNEGEGEASEGEGESNEGEGEAPLELPAWRQGMSPFSWRQLPTTSLQELAPMPSLEGVDANGLPMLGGPGGRIDAWNGLAADPLTNRLYSAANGGHADWAGNDVYELDLSQDTPTWVMLRGPTDASLIFRGDYNFGVYSDYYLDGRPGSTHSYFALQFLPTRGAVFRFGCGSLYGTGNEGNNKIDSFVISTNDWSPAGTYPDLTPTRTDPNGLSICKTSNDDVYVAGADNLRKFVASTGEVEVLSGYPQNHTAMKTSGCVVDEARQVVVFFGDAYRPPDGGLLYSISNDAFTEIDFTGAATNSTTSWVYAYGFHDLGYDQYFLKTNAPGELVQVNPDTFEATLVATTGGEAQLAATNGVLTRFQHLPALGGYAYYPPRREETVWFLATE
jgi:hypothetical protein